MPAAVGGCGVRAATRPGVQAPLEGGAVAIQASPLSRALTVLLLVCAAALLSASSAHAEEVFTGQAAAAYATDSTWIGAPAAPAAICIVDTGNDANADTSNVVARLAVDDGAGADLGTTKHGTLMSMIASAPYNGFGMVGAAPTIKVVSVRATRDGGGFGFVDLLKGIDRCRLWRNTYNIKVVSLSLGARNTGPLDAATQQAIADSVDTARSMGLNVIAAAGNQTGPVDWPAAYGPVFAVGATDNAGARCGFAASGPEVDLWAAGCPQDVALPDGRPAWASGSSESTAFVAGVLTQLRGLRPELSVTQAEALLSSSVRSQAAGGTLDVAAAFHAAGLDQHLAQGHAAIPALPPSGGAPATTATTIVPDTAPPQPPAVAETSPTQSPAPVQQPTAAIGVALRGRLAKPQVRSLRLTRGLLTLTLKNRPKAMEARVQIYARKKGRAFPRLVRTLRMTADTLRTRVLGTLSELSIIYRDPSGVREKSAVLRLRSRP
jgi:hypothetical protein